MTPLKCVFLNLHFSCGKGFLVEHYLYMCTGTNDLPPEVYSLRRISYTFFIG